MSKRQAAHVVRVESSHSVDMAALGMAYECMIYHLYHHLLTQMLWTYRHALPWYFPYVGFYRVIGIVAEKA